MQKPTASQCKRWGWNPDLCGPDPSCPATALVKLCVSTKGVERCKA